MRLFPRLGWHLSASVVLCFLMAAAQAATPVTSTLKNTASVPSSCVIKSLSGLSFGAYDPTSAVASQAQGGVSFVCTKGATYTLTPNAGLNNNHLMGAGGATLTYGLFSDSAMSVPFGTPTGSGTSLPSVGSVICVAASTNTKTQPTSGNYVVINDPIQGSNPYYYYTNILSTNASTYTCTHNGYNNTQGFYFTVVAANGTYSRGCTNSNCGTLTATNTIAAPASNQVSFVMPLTAQGITGTATSVNQVITKPFYGKLAAQQDVQAGAYSDTVILTVTF